MEQRDSTTLTPTEKASILSLYSSTNRGDHETTVDYVARFFGVSDNTVRLLVAQRRGIQEDLEL